MKVPDAGLAGAGTPCVAAQQRLPAACTARMRARRLPAPPRGPPHPAHTCNVSFEGRDAPARLLGTPRQLRLGQQRVEQRSGAGIGQALHTRGMAGPMKGEQDGGL